MSGLVSTGLAKRLQEWGPVGPGAGPRRSMGRSQWVIGRDQRAHGWGPAGPRGGAPRVEGDQRRQGLVPVQPDRGSSQNDEANWKENDSQGEHAYSLVGWCGKEAPQIYCSTVSWIRRRVCRPGLYEAVQPR